MLETLKARRSIRSYKPDQIEDAQLDAILEAGLYAASGMNTQNTIMVAVRDKQTRDQLSRMNAEILGVQSDPFYGAPVILIVLAKKDIPTHIYDGSLVMGNLMNAAESLGVDSIWIHRAKEEFESDFGKNILAKLGITDEYEGIGHCALGYKADALNAPAPRKDNYVYYI